MPLAPGCEVTVECNPDTVTPELLAAYAAGGRQPDLPRRAVDGRPRARRARAAPTTRPTSAGRSSWCREAGIPTFNLDLIYGAAGETLDDWRRTLDAALALDPPHVSAYALTVEPGTPLADDPARHPDDDDQADKYLLAADAARGAPGWPGTRSRTGPGPATSAATTSSTGRWASTWRSAARPTPTATAAGSGTCARPSATSRRSRPAESPEAAGEQLDADDRRLEALQLAVRTRDGRAGRRRCRVDELATWWRSSDDDRAVLTVRGRLLANEVALRLR